MTPWNAQVRLFCIYLSPAGSGFVWREGGANGREGEGKWKADWLGFGKGMLEWKGLEDTGDYDRWGGEEKVKERRS